MRLRLFERWKGLVPGQQISVVVLGVCGAISLGLALYRVRQNVYAPFLVDKAQILASKQVIGLTDEQVIDQEKRRDTDGDGLSDWDETNRFKTNPNLYDSCGDGLPDNIRIYTGKNVNCRDTGGNSEGRIDMKLLTTPSQPGQLGAVPSAPKDATPLDKTFFQDMTKQTSKLGPEGEMMFGTGTSGVPPLARDPELIRAALKDKLDPATLAKLTDEQLLELYDKAVASWQGSATTTTP